MDTRMNLSDEENELYTKLFVQCDLDGYGYVSGNTTCELFRKSGLSDNILFSIWEIADRTNSGQLDFPSFCICLRLIGHVQVYGPHALRDSDILINKTPEELPYFSGSNSVDYRSMNQTGTYDSDPSLFVISKSDYEGYKYTFLQLTPDLGDFLNGEDAKNFYLNTTTLSQDDLMYLWSLSDIDKDGRLNFKEFCIMQKLCECLKMYGSMPRSLPDTLFDFLETGYESEFNNIQSNKINENYYTQDEVDPHYLPPGLEHNVDINKEEKGFRNDTFVNPNTDLVKETTSNKVITNELIVQCENILNTLKDAINSEKTNYLTINKDATEIENKLKSDTKTLENLLLEYRSLIGDTQNVSKRRILLNNKLSIVQEQIQELRNQIQSIRVGNVALSSNIDKNNEEQSLLQNTRQMFLKQLEEDNNFLKIEERELGEMSNTLQQLRRQRDLLMEKNIQLKECLSQSENATKTMLRSIQLQQGKIMSVRNERINLLEEKLKLTNEINKLNNSENNLNSSSQNNQSIGFKDNLSVVETSSNKNSVNRNLNLDKKGIRVTSSTVRVGDEFPQ